MALILTTPGELRDSIDDLNPPEHISVSVNTATDRMEDGKSPMLSVWLFNEANGSGFGLKFYASGKAHQLARVVKAAAEQAWGAWV